MTKDLYPWLILLVAVRAPMAVMDQVVVRQWLKFFSDPKSLTQTQSFFGNSATKRGEMHLTNK